MDKSTEYIRMCRAAKDIQALWKQRPGDFFACSNNVITCWVPGICGPPQIKGGFGVEAGQNLIRISKYTWLPRHHQLVELALQPPENFRDTSFEFFEWSDMPYGTNPLFPKKIFHSIEQIWLAFIMEKKFGKTWTDGSWQKPAQTNNHAD